MKKKFLSILMVFLLLLSLSSCSVTPEVQETEKTPSTTVSWFTLDDDTWMSVAEESLEADSIASDIWNKIFPTDSENEEIVFPSLSYGEWREEDLPVYEGEPSVVFNDNVPFFTDAEKSFFEMYGTVYEEYAPLDDLGRCGPASAMVCKAIMPTEERGSIGMVKPSGWVSKKYDTSIVDGGYVYNRCHLIAFMLAGENANEKNLITGTRYMNVNGMLPYENLVHDYAVINGHYVMYRVTPVFIGDELVARGVIIEAYSMDDHGETLNFCVYCFNVQPGIEIDYKTGDNWLKEEGKVEEKEERYILNTSSMKFHRPDCDSIGKINEKNKSEISAKRSDLIRQGYKPCGVCNP